MGEINVLAYDGTPIAAAERWERLSMHAATYSEEDQEHLVISSVALLED